MAEVSTSELACVYSALILYDDDIDITGEKMAKIISVAKVNVEAFWPGLFAKALQGRNIGDLICNVGSAPAAGGAAAPAAAGGDAAAPAAEEKKEEKKAESSESGSDDDMGFGLFD
jgi:large subunit ribosomal protein LP1